ncbi:NAD(P)H-binding protein [Nocardia sp. NPDC052566]|uniref:NAD(P)H-binding protein n=1 Tax=Nocardia sp. NPDC052566 TaxID=3364330 RepID=UPI0037C8FCBA
MTGATGTVGRNVVELLMISGVEVRALTRRPESTDLPAATEVVVGDLAKPEGLTGVFDGVDRLYLIAAGERPEQVVDAAKQAGVRRVVTLSCSGAGLENNPGGEADRASELVVERSGLEWTHVRPGMFASNLLEWAACIKDTGIVRLPYDNARQSPVDELDVAAVAVAALLDDAHVNKVYPLSGPEALTKSEQFAAIAKAIGRDVRVEEITPEQWREEGSEQFPGSVMDRLLACWESALVNPEPVLPGVEQVLGRPARSLAEWADLHSDDFC